jgi:hypothetical protein
MVVIEPNSAVDPYLHTQFAKLWGITAVGLEH